MYLGKALKKWTVCFCVLAGCASGRHPPDPGGPGGALDAFQKGDFERARGVNDRVAPLVRVFYAPPFVDMHNRMKEALVLLGRIPAAYVRPPLTPVSHEERDAIRRALAMSGLAPETR